MGLVGLEGMSREQLVRLLDRADDFLSEKGEPLVPSQALGMLSGKAVALLFFEPSTRTRVSFELAAKRLGATVVQLTEIGSSLKKGETVLDTLRNLRAMGMDLFVVRHRERGIAAMLDRELDVPIVNAGDGTGEHPTQGLLDTLVLRRRIGEPGGAELEGRTIAYVGDVAHSRVARSGSKAMQALGARVVMAGPEELLPADRSEWPGVEFSSDRKDVLARADAVIVLRIQRERLEGGLDEGGYQTEWRMTRQVVEEDMKPEAWVMHPGPVIRGEEMTGEVADGPRSLILEQVSAGVAVRQAVLLDALASE